MGRQEELPQVLVLYDCRSPSCEYYARLRRRDGTFWTKQITVVPQTKHAAIDPLVSN